MYTVYILDGQYRYLVCGAQNVIYVHEPAIIEHDGRLKGTVSGKITRVKSGINR